MLALNLEDNQLGEKVAHRIAEMVANKNLGEMLPETHVRVQIERVGKTENNVVLPHCKILTHTPTSLP